ncbi:MAG: RNA-splicing factor [Phylliscum demangeonii]|nr:MAG: RNA-splicing factor [Phylliscum demangeonii]
MASVAVEATVTTAHESAAVFKKRSAKSKSNVRKRPATPPAATVTPSDSDSSDASSDEADESGRGIKRRRKIAGTVAASSSAGQPPAAVNDLQPTSFTADRSATIESTHDATKQSNWYDKPGAGTLDAKSLLGTTRSKPEAPDVSAAGDGTYKGAANYRSFVPKKTDGPSSSRQMGPVKAPTNIRTITVTDFAPDVCKDYKQTGFCGFGDSCKFLHAREDYKQGWELDRDWEINTKGKKLTGKTVASANRSAKADDADADADADEEAMLEKIPFACIICKKAYCNPVITRCGHYFCEDCALQRYRKTPACVACGAGTGGVFNAAKQLRKLLEKKRERARKRKEAQRAEGADVSDDDDDDDGDDGNGDHDGDEHEGQENPTTG